MHIETEGDIDAATVKALRESLKLTQSEFWEPVCVRKGRGCVYETGRTAPIPAEVRRLVFLHYVVGVPTDLTSKELAELAELAKFASPVRRARREMHAAADLIDQAGELLRQAKGAMNVQP